MQFVANREIYRFRRVSESVVKKNERQSMREAARLEAERWGWPSATEQLRGFYKKILNQEDLNKTIAA